MKGLPALTALSLYIWTAPTGRIIFGKAGFSALKYFKLKCSEPLLKFEAGAMPNLRKLDLVFNAHKVQHDAAPICIDHLSGLKEISAKIVGAGAAGTESAVWIYVRNDAKNPKINDRLVNWKFYADEDRITVTPEHAGGIGGELSEILEENTEYEYKGEDENRQSDSGISALLESSPTWARARPTMEGRPPTTLKAAYEGRGLPWWQYLASCNAGMFSSGRRKHGSKLSDSSSPTNLASMPPSTKTECKILQEVNVKVFSYNDLRLATRNFRPDSVLGEGGFGFVYKGWLDEHKLSACKPGTGMPVAVKRLNQEGFPGHREWLAQINYLGRLCHPNLVKLIGYCLEDEYRLLVYECMPRGSLETHLFRRGSHFQPLSWNLKMKVALGAAKGLAYLHSAEANVIYRDFKTSHILLDTDYTAKLSDFGLAKDGPVGEDSHVTTRVMGTYGYAAPEYISTGHLTSKCDVYGFGVVLLEMLCGRRALDHNRPQAERSLVEWARPYLISNRRIFRVMDKRLGGQYSLNEARKIANLAVACLHVNGNMRPTMDYVVSILEGVQDS